MPPAQPTEVRGRLREAVAWNRTHYVTAIAGWLARLSHAFVALVRDLAGTPGDGSHTPAQLDDVLDARADDDGIDATGL